MATRSTRSVKKIEKAKPLKIIPTSRHSTSDVPGQITLSTLEDVMLLMDSVITAINRKTLNDDISYYTTALITKMKIFGQRMEEHYKDQLDKVFCQFRNASKDDSVDNVIRINLLHLIELRAMHWTLCSSVNAYYLSKCCIPDVGECNEATTPINCNNILSPGEIIKSSGKYSAPTKVPGKNYYKDEVVIRNADSGKVSPGAKERNVQITGPEEEKIVLAKQLIEDTIKRNASPIREVEKDIGSNSSLNSTASDDSGQVIGTNMAGKMVNFNSLRDESFEYKHTVVVAGKTIKLSSSDHDSLKWAKLSLETAAKQKDNISLSTKYTQTVEPVKHNSNNNSNFNDHTVTRSYSYNEQVDELKNDVCKNDVTNYEASCKLPIQSKKFKVKLIQYTREFLLDLSNCVAAAQIPPNWDKVSSLYPAIVKQGTSFFDAANYAKKWLENEGKTVPLVDANVEYYDSD